MREFGLSASVMGLLLSAFFWTYGAFQLPAGWAVDRLGIRRSYFVAFLLWSLASASMALSQNAQSMFGLRLLLGVAESVGPLASLAFIRLAFSEEERGLPVSIYIAGQTIGPACGALIGSSVIATAGWRVLFAATGLIALLWLPLWWYFARLSGPKLAKTTERVDWKWSAIFSSRAFWAMSFCVFLFSYFWYFLLTWIPTYLNVSRGFPMIEMGRILSVPLFIMAPVNIAIGWLADRAIRRNQNALRVRVGIAIAGFLGATLILLLVHVQSRRSVLLVLILSVCSFGAASTNFWAIVQHIAPAAFTARLIAYFNTLSQVAGALAPIVTGYTLGPAKNFTVAISLAGVSALSAALLLVVTGPQSIQTLKSNFES